MFSQFRRGRVRPRTFHYNSRFHDPSKDERLKRRMRAARPRPHHTSRQPAFIAVGLGLVVVLYLYVNLDTIVERAAAFGGFFFGG